MICSAPPQIVHLPIKIFSPFLIGMAKEAKTTQILILIPAPSSYLQFVMIVQ